MDTNESKNSSETFLCCCYNIPWLTSCCVFCRCIPDEAEWTDYSQVTSLSKHFVCRVLWIITGWIAFIVGIIGIVLPILPTTPFMLVAAFCWARGSIKFYNFLMNHPLFGNLIRTFVQHKIIPLRAKIIASILIIASISTSAYFFVPLMIAQISMGIIGFCVIVYIWHFPSKRKDIQQQENGAVPTDEEIQQITRLQESKHDKQEINKMDKHEQ